MRTAFASWCLLMTTASPVRLMMTVTPLEKSIDVDVKEGASGLVASASMGLDQAPTLSLKKSLSF